MGLKTGIVGRHLPVTSPRPSTLVSPDAGRLPDIIEQVLLAIIYATVILTLGCSGTEQDDGRLNPGQGTIAVSADRYELRAGEEFSAEAVSTLPGTQKIVVELGTVEKKEALCAGAAECRLSAKIRPREGAYRLTATAFGPQEKALGQDVKTVRVLKAGKTCVEGTPFGECSREKPLYCDNGSTISDCAKCGCPLGMECTEGKCVYLEGAGEAGVSGEAKPSRAPGIDPLSVVFHYPAVIITGKSFTASVDFTPLGDIPAGVGYEAEIHLGGKRFSGKYISGGDNTTDIVTVKIHGVSLDGKWPEGMGVDMNFALYSLNAEMERLFYTETTLPATRKLTPPKSPELFSAIAEGDDVVLSWLPMEGAAEYRVYKSTNANPLFIQYRLHGSVGPGETSMAVQALPVGMHFFVIKAVDYFGNESQYSAVRSVRVG